MAPYLVLLALAGLGLALGWRLTPAPSEREGAEGIARLLQFAIAATGLLAIVLLMVPFFASLGAIECTPEAERAGECLLGVEERGLFGAATFACLAGVAFSFVLRKGLFDLLDDAARIIQRPTKTEPQATTAAQVEPEDEAEPQGKAEPETQAEPEGKAGPEDGAEPETQGKAEPETQAEPDETQAEPEDKAEPETQPEPRSHRRLEGPVFQAFVDDRTVDLEVAIQTAAKRLRSDRVAVVFSRGASKDANEALLELAEVFNAYRYVLEGTAAATEGLKISDKPEPHEADEVAGPDARHAMQLALDLAGSLIETVFLLDTRVAFPAFVLDQLNVLQSVCIAHSHDEVSAACQIVLPGTNPGEREGELSDNSGGENQRRPRAWLVQRLIEAVREQGEASEASEASESGPGGPAAEAKPGQLELELNEAEPSKPAEPNEALSQATDQPRDP